MILSFKTTEVTKTEITPEKINIHLNEGYTFVIYSGKRRITITDAGKDSLKGILGIEIEHLNDKGEVTYTEERGWL